MAEVLKNLSEDLAATVAGAGPAVVRVEGRRRLPASGIVWSTEGIIVTAHHVLESDENITVGLPDGKSVPATLVGRDPTTDLAVLRADSGGVGTPSWAELDDLQVGHLVLGLGRPRQTVMATLGIVGALGEGWRTPAGGRVDRYLQTDVTMYPGFSGGPLVDASGRVLGVNTSALLRGITITVPTSTVRRVVDTLLAEGRIRRGYLGVGAQPVQLSSALSSQIGQETALLLVSIESSSPAEKGGLLMGDSIVALDGQPVRHLDDLLGLLSGERIGKSVQVRILRGGQIQELKVVVGERG